MHLHKKHFAFYIATILLLFKFSPTQSQNTEKWGVGIHPFGGFVWAHTPEVSNLKSHIYGSSIDLRFKTAKRKIWHKEYSSPSWGIRMYYAYLGNPNITGNAYGILPYVDMPIIKKYSWKWSIRGTWGLGYITSPFSLNENVINRTVGSRINANMSLHGVISTFINPKLELTMVGGLTHFSNGNIRQPNLGINLPDVSIGLTYYIQEKEVEETTEKTFDSAKKEYSFMLLAASKNIGYVFPNQVVPLSFQTKYLQSLTSKSKLGGGIDLFYDEGNFYAENSPKKVRSGFENAFEVGIKAAYEMKINRLSFIGDFGIYLYNPNRIKGRLYQQLGFRWRASNKISLYSILKAHFDSADFILFGIGYTLNNT